jgi:hypothetical protein
VLSESYRFLHHSSPPTASFAGPISDTFPVVPFRLIHMCDDNRMHTSLPEHRLYIALPGSFSSCTFIGEFRLLHALPRC